MNNNTGGAQTPPISFGGGANGATFIDQNKTVRKMVKSRYIEE